MSRVPKTTSTASPTGKIHFSLPRPINPVKQAVKEQDMAKFARPQHQDEYQFAKHHTCLPIPAVHPHQACLAQSQMKALSLCHPKMG